MTLRSQCGGVSRSVAIIVAAVCLTSPKASLAQRIRVPLDQARMVHDRIFNDPRPGDILSVLQATTGDVEIPAVEPIPAYPFLPDAQAVLRMLLCHAPLAAVGRVTQRTVRMSANQSTLYTEFVFRVQEVVRNNQRDPVATGDDILVVVKGGEMVVQGRRVRIVRPFAELEPGPLYFLPLTSFVEATGAYRATPSGVRLTEPRAIQLRHHALPFLSDLSGDEIVRLARSAAASLPSECQGRGGR